MGCSHGTSALQVDGDFPLQYSIGTEIGAGSFGKVHEATHRESGVVRAVKVINIRKGSHKAVLEAWEEERAWRRVGNHNNIVQLCSVFGGDRSFFMVMERCEGSLMDRLPDIVGSDGHGLRAAFKQMLKGLAQVHKRRVVHRDIKPANFLVGGPDGRTIKLCDFGMSAVESRNGGELLSGTFGTTPYMSPEMVGKLGHDRSTDIWSFGATAYVMVFGDVPYNPRTRSPKDIKVAILYGAPAPSFKCAASKAPSRKQPSQATVTFVKSMMQREPYSRKSADELLRQTYLSPSDTQEKLLRARSNSINSLLSVMMDGGDAHMSITSTKTGGTQSRSATNSTLASSSAFSMEG
mmetsp:Transcript_69720/g.179760  ORF Transcript_69720/g.179760 Transcript_69720/m.179760 type:complete len:350 (+) Transcript_69720:100-1149(+)|eukprot:CAMPEP_0195079424 /NCGR_PEP_ID=MMETSP0448-20130528/21349_1 /TAXON_ID=66468 /ORGANISM="Heterocapsa triquestra, Strain CCMP 448" /LENGTH=349 /DNA_ID=CAMNT_0040112257 /DNA_START=1 /DNA_END=1050 /DNA_ORIENTATION=+